MTRAASILDQTGWSQLELSTFLGQAQSAVSRLVRGQPEPGPVSRLLDLLEFHLARGDVRPGMSPDEVAAVLHIAPASPAAA